jgi:hypothetical protein
LQLQLALLDEVVLLSRESYHFAFLVRFRDFFELLLRHRRLFRGNYVFRIDVALVEVTLKERYLSGLVKFLVFILREVKTLGFRDPSVVQLMLQNFLPNFPCKLSLFVTFTAGIIHKLVPTEIKELPIYHYVTVPYEPVIPNLVNHFGVVGLAHLFQVELRDNNVAFSRHR